LERTNSCPPQNRAASTKPTTTGKVGFVEASPSRVLRDGEGTFLFKLSHYLTSRCRRLRGTIRGHVTQQRGPFLRFFACHEDLSRELPHASLPDAVASGEEPFLIIGPFAGG